MARRPRVSYPGAYLHVMNHATQHNMPLFQSDEDYSLFINYLRDKSLVYGIKPIAYCLMPNHYHLFLLTTTGEISRFIQTLQSSYARMINKKAEKGERKYIILLKGKIRYNIIIDIVLGYFGKKKIEEIRGRDYKSTNIREILAYFLYHYTLLTTKDIAEILGYAHRSTITLASKRIEIKMENNEIVRNAVETIADTMRERVVNL